MSSNEHYTPRDRLFHTKENPLPSTARFAISAMNGKFRVSESQLKGNFMDGLLALIQNDSMCALEKMLSSSGSKCLQNALTVQMDRSFWTEYIVPLLEALSADELQLGCRRQLTTAVFQNMLRMPFFLQKFAEFVESDVVDPVLALSIVDRTGTADRSFMEDNRFTAAVRVLGTKLRGQMREHLLRKFRTFDERSDDCKSEVIIHDTTVKSLREMKFDRHDNDSESIAEIELLPTKQELNCTSPPYLPLASNPMSSPAALFEAHFRWLREDMVAPIREAIALLRSQDTPCDAKSHRIAKRVRSLTFGPIVLEHTTFDKYTGIGIVISFPHPKPFEPKNVSELSEVKRTTVATKHYDNYWRQRSDLFRKGSVVVLVHGSDREFVRFGEIVHGNSQDKPLKTNPGEGTSRVTVRFEGKQFSGVLSDMLTQRKGLTMVQLHLSFFAYKPILRRLQEMKASDFISKLLPGNLRALTGQSPAMDGGFYHHSMDKILKSLHKSDGNIMSLLPQSCGGSITLDKQQCMAVELAFSTPVSLIQGPPGTGKSLCGAVIGALLHRFTKLRVLCVCFTNHALDDYLNDLMKIGVPNSDILRIGSGCRADPESPLGKTRIENIRSNFPFPSQRPLRRLIACTNASREQLREEITKLEVLATQMTRRKWKSIKDYLLTHDGHLLSAFTLDSSDDGYKVAGISEGEIWEKWISGKSAPKSASASAFQHELWSLPKQDRKDKLAKWIEDVVSHVESFTVEYDRLTARLRELYDEGNSLVLQSRRIIGCTTTGASKFSRLLDGTAVDVLIMEEAGEILEAHSIAAIGNQVCKLVLIGDHLQLRPKIGNHLLGVEFSEGRYTLDVSLFERLIENGVQHVTLEQQHRMCPSIAAFVTNLTYPLLRTAATVKRRKLVGAPNSVIFVNHSELEDSKDSLQGDENTLSHTNTHEVEWVLALTRYFLCQPEYKAGDIVVLTPYLGQAVLLRNALSDLSNTSVRMNERDIADLIKAGEDVHVSESNGNGKAEQKKIRVATIDNFQGEEGNIVIASLVRSNENNAIGFLAQPQRINVLLSRAKEAMILVGNSATLTGSKKGGDRWRKVIEIFQQQGAVDQGISVSCHKHGAVQVIRSPKDFAEKAPHGGCDLPCDAELKCSHFCQRSCHRGPCASCLECARQKQLQREQEVMIRKTKQILIRNQSDREKLEIELDQKREQILLKQDQILHTLELEKFKLENDLLEKESKLIETKRTSNVENQIKHLRKNHTKEVRALEARFNNQSVGTSEKSPKSSSEQSEKISTEQIVTDIRGCNSKKLRPDSVPLDEARSDDVKSTLHEKSIAFTLEDEWQLLRRKVSFCQRKGMDTLMKLIGLRGVKTIALEVFKKELADQQLKVDGLGDHVIRPTLNFAFVGNPGTGKTTVARLFTEILVESGARKGSSFENLTASELLRLGEEKFAARISSMCGSDAEKAPPLGLVLRRNLKVEVLGTDNRWYAAKVIQVDEQKNEYTVEYASDGSEEKKVQRNRVRAGSELPKKGGVLFIDEAYDLAPSRNRSGAAIVNMLMESAEKHREKLTIILAGYQKDIEEQLFAFNDGMPSRFREVVFDDFDETELRRIWEGLCKGKGYVSHAKVSEVAARHVALGRGVRGFGNARSVRSLFESACAKSLSTRTGSTLHITTEDVLGQRPSPTDPKIARIIDELNSLIGLSQVKESFTALVTLAVSNYDREMKGLPLALVPLNRVFVGNPGTGKTTVARLYGALLKALGFLSNGEVVSKVASDLMGQYIGEAQQRTRVIVENARGKVLLIDEAYGLDEKHYGKQVLDTIVERVSGAPGEDIAVVFIGYEEEIRKMIDNQNPGLKRRFNMDVCKMTFEDLTDEEIHTLVGIECRRSGVEISDEAHSHATKLLVKQRSKPNFGNAGNVKGLVKTAVGRLTSRGGPEEDAVLSVREIDPDYEPDADPLEPLHDLEDTPVKEHLMDLALQLQVREKEGRSTEGLLGNYVFTGAPGTGKTTVARKLAKVLFNMRVLASDLVVETSSSDLIGAYIGHSRRNVERKMKEARGGVCFIDEAYQLGVGHFGNEALTQLLTMLTLPEYMNGKTIVVLAGYENEMHRMLESNPGLKSRFSSYLRFDGWASEKCVSFCCKLAAAESPKAFTLDPSGKALLRKSFEEIRKRPGWANARDVIQLFKQIITARDVRIAKGSSSEMQTDTSLIATDDIDKAVSEMLRSRPRASAQRDHSMNARSEMSVQICQEREVRAFPHRREPESVSPNEQRSLDKPIETQLKRDIPDDVTVEEDAKSPDCDGNFYGDLLKEITEVEKKFAGNPNNAYVKGYTAERERLTREKEEYDRLVEEKQLALKRAQAAKEERERQRMIENARKKEEELQQRLRKEAQRQRIRRVLMTVGKCVQGFAWLRLGNGYQCAGGSHFANFEDIAVKTGFTVEEVRDAFEK